MRTIVLKIDVDTYRGTKEGVPRLVRSLTENKSSATFLFSLGPDHTGWALRRIFRPGFFKKVQRTSVLEHYGLKTLMYGVFLPAPHIGQTCAEEMRSVRDAGFEVGIHSYDHVYWQDNVSQRDKAWTLKQLNLSATEFLRVFGAPAKTHGAAGWQMNEHGFEWLEQFQYSSDCRGDSPFYPLIHGAPATCLQMPTTLPTMDEILGSDGVTEENIHEKLLSLTENEKPFGHVFTLHAELEGLKLLPAFTRFLDGLKKQNYEFLSQGEYFSKLQNQKLPVCEIEYAEIAGRSGRLCKQKIS